jgi:hypothetical protein
MNGSPAGLHEMQTGGRFSHFSHLNCCPSWVFPQFTTASVMQTQQKPPGRRREAAGRRKSAGAAARR